MKTVRFVSSFDGMEVVLRICSREEARKYCIEVEGNVEGQTEFFEDRLLCAIWIEKFDWSPFSIATLAHEVSHASRYRSETIGVDDGCGEFQAYSTSEIMLGLLGKLEKLR